jgi:predicted RNA polymerase sigma factor
MDAAEARAIVDEVYRVESRRVLATLIRLLGDFDLAEEALHDAFRAALEKWPSEGVPTTPAHGSCRSGVSGRSTASAGTRASTLSMTFRSACT